MVSQGTPASQDPWQRLGSISPPLGKGSAAGVHQSVYLDDTVIPGSDAGTSARAQAFLNAAKALAASDP
jgi:hypothetical protein